MMPAKLKIVKSTHRSVTIDLIAVYLAMKAKEEAADQAQPLISDTTDSVIKGSDQSPDDEVASVMLEATDFVEAAMSQPQSPDTSIMLEMAEADEEQQMWERRFAALYRSHPSWRTADQHGSWGLRDFLAYATKTCGFEYPPKSKEQSNADR